MLTAFRPTSVKMDAAGRLVVPRELRDALGLPDGGELRLTVENGELRATTRQAALRRIQAEAVALGAASLSAELLAERRAEARRGLHEDQAPAPSLPRRKGG